MKKSEQIPLEGMPAKKVRPLVFLDFDGVINSKEYWETKSGVDLMGEPFSQALVDRITGFLERVDGRVVISSAWRLFNFPDGYIEGKLAQYGFPVKRIIGYTPMLIDNMQIRGIEIQSWLINNKEIGTPFVILDDRDNMGWLNDRLVHTDIAVGVQHSDIRMAEELLGYVS